MTRVWREDNRSFRTVYVMVVLPNTDDEYVLCRVDKSAITEASPGDYVLSLGYLYPVRGIRLGKLDVVEVTDEPKLYSEVNSGLIK